MRARRAALPGWLCRAWERSGTGGLRRCGATGKLLADLLVGQAGGGQHRDQAFLRREPVACWLIGAGIGWVGCLELAGGPAGPRPGAEAFERKPRVRTRS
jgi:hypothetical protein